MPFLGVRQADFRDYQDRDEILLDYNSTTQIENANPYQGSKFYFYFPSTIV